MYRAYINNIIRKSKAFRLYMAIFNAFIEENYATEPGALEWGNGSRDCLTCRKVHPETQATAHTLGLVKLEVFG